MQQSMLKIMELLKCKNLTKNYGDKEVLKGINLTISTINYDVNNEKEN